MKVIFPLNKRTSDEMNPKLATAKKIKFTTVSQ